MFTLDTWVLPYWTSDICSKQFALDQEVFLILNSSFPLRQYRSKLPYGFIIIIAIEQNEQITYEISVNTLKSRQKRRDEVKNNLKCLNNLKCFSVY